MSNDVSHFSGPHERTDGSPRVIALAAGVLLVTLAAGVFVGGWAFNAKARTVRTMPRSSVTNNAFEHGPHARTGIALDWEKQDAAVADHLGRYAWVDRNAGRVRIPIERAMELIAQPEDRK